MRTLFLSAAVALLASCGSSSKSSTGPGVTVATVTVTAATASVAVAATDQLTAVAKDASGNVVTGQTVTWSSSSTANATVSASGLVTGVAAGPVVISAAAGGKSGAAQVQVSGVIRLP